MVPPEVHVDLGTMRIYAYRALLILMIPAIVRKLGKGEVQLNWIDFFLSVSAAWFVISMSMHYGIGTGLENGGALSLDLVMAYMIARCYVTNLDALGRVLNHGAIAVAISGAFMMMESISGHLLVRPALASLFGLDQGGGALRVDFRRGFLRAFGPFPHPILGGLQMSSYLPLYALVVPKGPRRLLGLGGSILGLFSFSSAAFIGIFTNISLMIYERLRMRIRQLTWPLLAGTGALILIAVQLVSENGALAVIIRYLTMDPATGRYRLWIWQYGWQNILENPLFGVGREAWDRPSYMVSDSIDAHFLWLAVHYGTPAALSLIAAAIGTMLLMTRRINATPEGRERTALVGIYISLFTLLLLMFTVTLWSNSMAWLVMLTGSAVSISTSAGAPLPKRRRLRFTFGARPAMRPLPAHADSGSR